MKHLLNRTLRAAVLPVFVLVTSLAFTVPAHAGSYRSSVSYITPVGYHGGHRGHADNYRRRGHRSHRNDYRRSSYRHRGYNRSGISLTFGTGGLYYSEPFQPRYYRVSHAPRTRYYFSNAAPGYRNASYNQAADNRYCREYQSQVTVGNRIQETYGTACQQPDGTWEIIN